MIITEELRGKRKIQEDDVWTEFEGYMRSWDPTKRKVDSLAEWQLAKAATQRQRAWKTGKILMTRAEEFGRSKDEDNPGAWIEKK